MKKFQADKLEPKADNCIFIGHPKQLGIPPVSDPKAIGIVSQIGSFLEEKFLSKELSGRLDEVIEPSLQLVCSRAQELFLWHLHQLKWKLMIVIMRLRIKSLPNLVGRQGCVLLQSGT